MKIFSELEGEVRCFKDLIKALAIGFVLFPVAPLMFHPTIMHRFAPTTLQYGCSSTNRTLGTIGHYELFAKIVLISGNQTDSVEESGKIQWKMRLEKYDT